MSGSGLNPGFMAGNALTSSQWNNFFSTVLMQTGNASNATVVASGGTASRTLAAISADVSAADSFIAAAPTTYAAIAGSSSQAFSVSTLSASSTIAAAGMVTAASGLGTGGTGVVIGTMPANSNAGLLMGLPSGYTQWAMQIAVGGTTIAHIDQSGNFVNSGGITASGAISGSSTIAASGTITAASGIGTSGNGLVIGTQPAVGPSALTIGLPAGYSNWPVNVSVGNSTVARIDAGGNIVNSGSITASGTVAGAAAASSGEMVTLGQAEGLFAYNGSNGANAVSAGATLTLTAAQSASDVFTNGASTITLPAGALGLRYVIHGNGNSPVTVNAATGGIMVLPDGSQPGSITIPSIWGAGIELIADGTNWRTRTFGQVVVDAATASNQAVALGQLSNNTLNAGFLSVAAGTNPWTGEFHLVNSGTWVDPDNGAARAIKVGEGGIAVLGGTKTDTLTTTGTATIGSGIGAGGNALVIGSVPSGSAAGLLVGLPSGYGNWAFQVNIGTAQLAHIDQSGNFAASGTISAGGVIAGASATSSGQMTTLGQVQSMLGGYAGFASIGANTTLSAAAANNIYQGYDATALTVTLPASIGQGETLTFYNQQGGALTLSVPSGSFLYAPPELGNTNTAMTLNWGDSAVLLGRGSGEYDLIGGTMMTWYANSPRFVYNVNFQNGITFANATATSPQSLSQHINLWGGNYGWSITNGTLNHVSGGSHVFYNGTTETFGIDGSGNVAVPGQISLGGGATIANYKGAASFGQNLGSVGTAGTFGNTGLFIGWNVTNGQGECDLLLGPQGGAGGLNIYQLTSTGAFKSSTPMLALDGSGNLTVAGTIAGVAAASSGEMVTLGQAQADFAALAGSSSQAFSVANAAASTEAAALGQVLGGYNQVYGQVAASRALNTSYTNSTGRPLFVIITVQLGSTSGATNIVVSGNTIMSPTYPVSSVQVFTFVVPTGATYEIDPPAGTILGAWAEL